MRPTPFVVYSFPQCDGFLIEAMYPDAVVVPASYDQSREELLDRLASGARGSFLFHIDLTFTRSFPPFRAAILATLRRRRYCLLNHRVVDISKRTLQRRVRRLGLATLTAPLRGDPDELLIVKSTFNCHGRSEGRLSRAERARLSLPEDCTLSPYLVARRRDVAARSWASRSLIVERFVANESGRFYRCYIAGRALIVCESYSEAQIKKMGYGLPRHSYFFHLASTRPIGGGAAPVHIRNVARDVAQVVEDAHLDFGTVDLVEGTDCRTYICDLNSTPYWGEREPDMTSFLRDGLMNPRIDAEGPFFPVEAP